MKAVFVSGIDYESPIQIGDHHLARQFASHGWEVAFISFPITPFHFFSKNNISTKRRITNYRSGGIDYKIGKGRIWSYVPGSIIVPKNKPFINNSFVYRNWHRYMFPKISGLLAINGFVNVELIYLRDPLQYYLIDAIPHDYSVFRIADNDHGFSSYNANYEFLEKEVAQSVDLVLYTASELETYVRSLNPRQYHYFPNGVDHSHFSKSDHSTPEDLLKINKPIAVYAGSIDDWFDFDLLNWLVESMPEISFVVIGPNEQYHERFIRRNNLFLLGQKRYEILPSYLYNSSVGIIPFDVQRNPLLVNAINPIKLLEYFSCSLPVVCTKWNELEKINSPAQLCSTYEDFRNAIRRSVEDSPDRDSFQKFAAIHDWPNRYRELMNLIKTD